MDTSDISMVEDENVKPKRAHPSDSESDSSPAKQPVKRRKIGAKPTPSPSAKKTEQKQAAAEEKEKKRKEQDEIKRQQAEEKEKKRKEQEELKAKKQEEKIQQAEEKERKRKEQEELKVKKLEEQKQQAEEKEKKRKEKEEVQRVRDETKRREKEEVQRVRDEKKRQKEEEKLQKQQAEQKKKALVERQSAIMKSFVIKLEPEEKKILGWGNEQFVPFEVKPAMNVAPAFRREPLIGEAYDNMLATSVEANDYLNKAKQIKRERIVKDPMRAKYFHFNNNYRPPYYGTWRKISKIITGRRPFALSHQELHYDIDSDAEWEEEQAEAGDDCLSDVEEGNNENSNETCDDFYVDHGYLSENEESDASESHEGENEEQRKRRMDQRAREFTTQNTTKRRRAAKKALTVQIYGLNWQPSNSSWNRYAMKAVVLRPDVKSTEVV